MNPLVPWSLAAIFADRQYLTHGYILAAPLHDQDRRRRRACGMGAPISNAFLALGIRNLGGRR